MCLLGLPVPYKSALFVCLFVYSELSERVNIVAILCHEWNCRQLAIVALGLH